MADEFERLRRAEGRRVTLQAIERAVERSDGSNDDRILRAVDPVLADAIDALPVGWEVAAHKQSQQQADASLTVDFSPETLATKIPGSSKRYTQQQQAAARAFRDATEQLEGVTVMSNSEAIAQYNAEQAAGNPEGGPAVDAKAAEAARQAPFVAKVVDRLAFMLANQQELQYLPQRDDGFIVDLGNGDGIRILAFYQQFYEHDYKAIAEQTARRLRHELTPWTFTGDRENIGELTRCANCGELGSTTAKGKRSGSIFTSRCTAASGVPGSLAGVKRHMDRAGALRPGHEDEVISDPRRINGEPITPSTEWTENEDSRR